HRLPVVAPAEVVAIPGLLAEVDRLAEEGIAERKMPGCVIAAGYRGQLFLLRAYGHSSLQPDARPMETTTVFDLASITKPVATATCMMHLWERGYFRLSDRVSKYIPEFAANGKGDVTIQQLFTHTSGLIPDNSIRDYANGKAEALQKIYDLSLRAEPAAKFMYSDVGFIVLGDLVERISGLDVHAYSQKHLYGPAGMTETGYQPAEALKQRAAVTEQRNGKWTQGEVHDPRSYAMGGIAGHAGLFSTAQDLAIYAQMMIQGGAVGDTQILSPTTVAKMAAAIEVPGATRSLGWDKQSGYSSNRAESLSPAAFGHGGFTGTVLWIDPELELFYIFLSNRVHPDGNGSVNHLAGRIGNVIVAAVSPEEP
ncbi:MAG: serine hydrolase domain-containing protein, partial [Planctomycetota bacterium]